MLLSVSGSLIIHTYSVASLSQLIAFASLDCDHLSHSTSKIIFSDKSRLVLPVTCSEGLYVLLFNFSTFCQYVFLCLLSLCLVIHQLHEEKSVKLVINQENNKCNWHLIIGSKNIVFKLEVNGKMGKYSLRISA